MAAPGVHVRCNHGQFQGPASRALQKFTISPGESGALRLGIKILLNMLNGVYAEFHQQGLRTGQPSNGCDQTIFDLLIG